MRGEGETHLEQGFAFDDRDDIAVVELEIFLFTFTFGALCKGRVLPEEPVGVGAPRHEARVIVPRHDLASLSHVRCLPTRIKVELN